MTLLSYLRNHGLLNRVSCGSDGKESAINAKDQGSVPRSELKRE